MDRNIVQQWNRLPRKGVKLPWEISRTLVDKTG